MAKAPTAADRLRVFLEWGNLCDAHWCNRTWIAEMLCEECAQISLFDYLELAEREFYDALPVIVNVY
jgi:hypothetical protein